MSELYNLIYEQYRIVDGDNRPVERPVAQGARWLESPGCVFQRNDFRLPFDVHSSAIIKAGLHLSVILSGDGTGGPSDGSAQISYSENTMTVMALREPTQCDGFAPRGAVMLAASLAFPVETIKRFGLWDAFLNLFEADGHGRLFFTLKAPPRMQAIAHEMLKPSVDGRPGELLLSAQALELLARTIFALQQRVDVRAHPTQPRLQSTKDLIDSNIGHPWSVAELARHAGLSRRSFHQHFAAAYGVSPADYLRTRRLELAREALVYQDMSVTEAAYFVGYASPANFATAFRRQFGVPPSACRRPKTV